MNVRLATAARPDDRQEFTAMNFDGDSAERMHPRLAQFVILVRALYTNNGARGNPKPGFRESWHPSDGRVSSCQTDEISTMVKSWTAAALRNAR